MRGQAGGCETAEDAVIFLFCGANAHKYNKELLISNEKRRNHNVTSKIQVEGIDKAACKYPTKMMFLAVSTVLAIFGTSKCAFNKLLLSPFNWIAERACRESRKQVVIREQ